MGTIPDTATWVTNVRKIETNEPLLGGLMGHLNYSVQDLANRTRWLYDNAVNLGSVQTIAASKSYAAGMRATGLLSGVPASGAGAELEYTGSAARLRGYNRATLANAPVQVLGSTVELLAGANSLLMDATGEVRVGGAAASGNKMNVSGVVQATQFLATSAASTANHLVRKAEFDAYTATGDRVKGAADAATTAALPAVTATATTLTATANGALASQDGVAMAVGSRLLVKNQATNTQNGLYSVTAAGSAGAAFVLTRVTDADGSPSDEVRVGDLVIVRGGSTQASTQWYFTKASGAGGNFTFGTDGVVMVQTQGAVAAGSGIAVSGNVVSIASGGIVNSMISAAAAIAWSKIDKTGAVLADLGGTVQAGQFPSVIPLAANALAASPPTSYAGSSSSLNFSVNAAYIAMRAGAGYAAVVSTQATDGTAVFKVQQATTHNTDLAGNADRFVVTAGGTAYGTRAGLAGGEEVLREWQLGVAGRRVRVMNLAATTANPRLAIVGEHADGVTTNPITIQGRPLTDAGAVAAVSLDGRLAAGGRLTATPLLEVENDGAAAFRVEARGALTTYFWNGSAYVVSNTAMGLEAMLNTTTAVQSVAIGPNSMRDSNANNQIAIGMHTGREGSGEGSVYIGHWAGRYSGRTTGASMNVGIGYTALQGGGTGVPTGVNNIGIGFQALLNYSSGSNNVAIGYDAGRNVTSGVSNTYVGHQAGLEANNTNTVAIGAFAHGRRAASSVDTRNTAVGMYAMYGSASGVPTGTYNTVLGYEALGLYTSGFNNIAIGFRANYNAADIGQTVAVGSVAMEENGATNDTAVGYEALRYRNVSVTLPSTALGYRALRGSATGVPTGTDNVAVGADALLAYTSGSGNVVVGHGASKASSTASNAVVIGYLAKEEGNIGAEVAIGYHAMRFRGVPSNASTAVGYQAMRGSATGVPTGAQNTALGLNTLLTYTSGSDNVAVGHIAMTGLTTGSFNVAVGSVAMEEGSPLASVAVGYRALRFRNAGNSDGDNVAVGSNALRGSASGVPTGTNNIGIGTSAGQNYTSGVSNTLVGWSAGTGISNSNNNVALGRSALEQGNGHNNVAVGTNAMQYSNVTAAGDVGNTAVGFSAARGSATSVPTGTFNVALGYGAMFLYTSGSDNVVAGRNSMYNASSASFNVALGAYALRGAAGGLTGGSNVAIGYGAVLELSSGAHNVAIGREALDAITTQSFNVALGSYALGTTTLSASSVALGYAALQGTALGTAANNVAIGHQAGSAINNGSGNVIIGFSSGSVGNGSQNIVDGNDNTWIGSLTGNALAEASSVVPQQSVLVGRNARVIGNYAAAVRTGGVAIGGGAQATYTDVVIGWAANSSVSTGTTSETRTTALGNEALRYATTAFETVAVGWQALRGDGSTSPTGSFNTVLGVRAGIALTSGASNVFVGHSAGASGTTGMSTGARNVAVGASAGNSATANGSSDTVSVGYQAVARPNGSIAVGSGAVVDTAATKSINIANGMTITEAGVASVGDTTTRQRLVTYGGRRVGNTTRVTGAVASYNVLGTDFCVVVAANPAAFAVNLPASPVAGDEYVVKDRMGANTNNITVSGNGKNIDGAASFVMNTQNQSVTFRYDGVEWITI